MTVRAYRAAVRAEYASKRADAEAASATFLHLWRENYPAAFEAIVEVVRAWHAFEDAAREARLFRGLYPDEAPDKRFAAEALFSRRCSPAACQLIEPHAVADQPAGAEAIVLWEARVLGKRR